MAYEFGRHITKNCMPKKLSALKNSADRRPRSFEPLPERHRHDAQCEHLDGDEAAAAARDQELEVVEREHLREATPDVPDLARGEERRDRLRRARPDEQAGAQCRNWRIPIGLGSVVSCARSGAMLAGASATNPSTSGSHRGPACAGPAPTAARRVRARRRCGHRVLWPSPRTQPRDGTPERASAGQWRARQESNL